MSANVPTVAIRAQGSAGLDSGATAGAASAGFVGDALATRHVFTGARGPRSLNVIVWSSGP